MKTQRGFAIIEMLVAMLILAVGLVTLSKLQSTITQDSVVAKQGAEAATLAQSKIESLRNFSVLNATTGQTSYDQITSGSDTITGTNATFTRTWTVTDSTDLQTKDIVMVVSWTANDGSSETLTYTSKITANAPQNSGKLLQGDLPVMLGQSTTSTEAQDTETTEQTTDNPDAQTTEQTTDNPDEQATEQTTDNPDEQATEQTTDEQAEDSNPEETTFYTVSGTVSIGSASVSPNIPLSDLRLSVSLVTGSGDLTITQPDSSGNFSISVPENGSINIGVINTNNAESQVVCPYTSTDGLTYTISNITGDQSQNLFVAKSTSKCP